MAEGINQESGLARGSECLLGIRDGIWRIDLTAYRADEKTKSAVERKIQVLTEAIIRLEDESSGEYPEIDQKGYRGMGNILRHSYHRVDDGIVWSTVKEDLPELRDIVEKLLRALPAKKAERPPNAE